MAITTYPASLFPPRRLRWGIAGTPLIGGLPVSGPPQTGDSSQGGWWFADYEVRRMARRDLIKTWRALAIQLQNGAAPMIVPCLDFCQPWPDQYPNGAPDVPHSDGALFMDGSGYETNAIAAELVSDVALHSRVAEIRVTVGAELTGGEYFSLTGPTQSKRLHLIGAIEDVDTFGGDPVYTVSFGPPTAEDYVTGHATDFQNLGCLMKLDPASIEDVWPWIEAPFRIQPKIRFVETFLRDGELA